MSYLPACGPKRPTARRPASPRKPGPDRLSTRPAASLSFQDSGGKRRPAATAARTSVVTRAGLSAGGSGPQAGRNQTQEAILPRQAAGTSRAGRIGPSSLNQLLQRPTNGSVGAKSPVSKPETARKRPETGPYGRGLYARTRRRRDPRRRAQHPVHGRCAALRFIARGPSPESAGSSARCRRAPDRSASRWRKPRYRGRCGWVAPPVPR